LQTVCGPSDGLIKGRSIKTQRSEAALDRWQKAEKQRENRFGKKATGCAPAISSLFDCSLRTLGDFRWHRILANECMTILAHAIFPQVEMIEAGAKHFHSQIPSVRSLFSSYHHAEHSGRNFNQLEARAINTPE
jgi:hypothetical protein